MFKINTFLTPQKNKTPCKSTTYKVFQVPRAGVEPARVAPLVFETSASTDSAIWAWVEKTNAFFAGAKIRIKSELANFQGEKMKKSVVFALFCIVLPLFIVTLMKK